MDDRNDFLMKRVQKEKHHKKKDRGEELPPVRRDKRGTNQLRKVILDGLDQLDDELDSAIRDGD